MTEDLKAAVELGRVELGEGEELDLAQAVAAHIDAFHLGGPDLEAEDIELAGAVLGGGDHGKVGSRKSSEEGAAAANPSCGVAEGGSANQASAIHCRSTYSTAQLRTSARSGKRSTGEAGCT
jgi:hypothetical protein